MVPVGRGNSLVGLARVSPSSESGARRDDHSGRCEQEGGQRTDQGPEDTGDPGGDRLPKLWMAGEEHKGGAADVFGCGSGEVPCSAVWTMPMVTPARMNASISSGMPGSDQPERQVGGEPDYPEGRVDGNPHRVGRFPGGNRDDRCCQGVAGVEQKSMAVAA